MIKWQLQTNPLKKEKKAENWKPQMAEDASWLQGKDDIIVWIGHSTFYIRINDVQLLTDPVFGDVLTVKRKTKTPVDPRLFNKLDFILLFS